MNSTVTDGGGSLGFPVAALPVVVNQLYIANYNVAASSALFFYDCLLTLDREVRFIWKSRFSFIVFLFSAIRLLAVGGQITFLIYNFGVMKVSESYCKGQLWFSGMLGLVMFACVDVLLIYRVYALYGRNKKLLWSLYLSEFLAFVSILVLCALAFPKFQIIPNPIPHQLHIGVCILISYSNLQPDLWLPLVPMQGILLFLAVGRYIYLQSKGPTMLNTTSHLYYTFMRDGVWTFFVLFADILLCVIGDNSELLLGPLALQWCYPVIGICASRLILNLRAASHWQESDDILTGASLTNTKLTFAGERINASAAESSEDIEEI